MTTHTVYIDFIPYSGVLHDASCQQPTANAPNSWSHTVITFTTLRDKIVFRLSEGPESPSPDRSPSWLLVKRVWRKCANAALVLRHDSFPPRGLSVIHIHESDVGELVGTGEKKEAEMQRRSGSCSTYLTECLVSRAVALLNSWKKQQPNNCILKSNQYLIAASHFLVFIDLILFTFPLWHFQQRGALCRYLTADPNWVSCNFMSIILDLLFTVCLRTLRVFCNSPAGCTCQSWSPKDEMLNLHFYYEHSKLRDTFPNFLPPTLPDAFARPNTAPGSGRRTAPCRPLWGGVALEKWGIMRFPQQRFENKLCEG